jgi:hypothetical protein
MAKKTLEQKIDALTNIVEKGFAASDRKFGAIAEDIADIRENMATKEQLIALHAQTVAIETDIRSMKQAKLEAGCGRRDATAPPSLPRRPANEVRPKACSSRSAFR